MTKINELFVSLLLFLNILNPVTDNLVSPLPNQDVLGIESNHFNLPSQTPTLIPTPTLTPKPIPTSTPIPPPPTPTKKTLKNSYKIVFLGDSMTDFLGDDFKYLLPLLKNQFPKTSFELLNYGIGATDIISGYNRLEQKSTRHDKELLPLLSLKPDIIIFESFAYNHWGNKENDLSLYKTTVEKIINEIESNNSIKLITALTIAPNSKIITDGIENLELSKDAKKEKAETIKKYTSVFKEIVKNKNLPIADSFSLSLDKNGEGKQIYINNVDHLHPNEEGLKLYSKTVFLEIEKMISMP